MKAFKHFKTITKHKIIVAKLCFRIGLYKQGLLHDMSKYSLCEFRTGVHYYQGTKSPNSVEREEKGYSSAWLHHKGRNKHHWEYWVDFTHKGLLPARIPIRYILEMFCDRIAASMTYQGKKYSDKFPLQYYKRGMHSYIMHPESRKLLEELLIYLDNNGLDQTIAYIKKEYVKKGI
ncbi:MAG: DUF5662 family protein [Coprobacillus sp.]